MDAGTGKRYTTVELIEEPTEASHDLPRNRQEPEQSPTRRLGVRIEYWETELRERVKNAGGIWRSRQKLWELTYRDVVALGLESRVVSPDQFER